MNEHGRDAGTAQIPAMRGAGRGATLPEKALSPLARGRDVVVLAPVSERQLADVVAAVLRRLPRGGKGPLVLFLSADKELAAAALRGLQSFEGPQAVPAVVLSEERAVRREAKDLEARPAAVVATPARLIDHIRRRQVCLSGIRCAVILEGGAQPPPEFRRDVQFIASKLPRRRQTVVVASGLTRESAAATYPLKRPVSIEPADLVPAPAPAPAAAPTRRASKDRQERSAVSTPIATGAASESRSGAAGTQPETHGAAGAAPSGRRPASIPDEKVLAQALETLLKTVRQSEDPDELNRYRQVFKRHVPIFMRSYVAAYLFKRSLDSFVGAPSNTAKLFVSIGKNRQVFAKDIIKLFMDRLGIQRSQIGEVKVLESYSFVDISLDHAQEAISKLSGINFRGRRLSVNLARKKGEGGDSAHGRPLRHHRGGQTPAEQ